MARILHPHLVRRQQLLRRGIHGVAVRLAAAARLSLRAKDALR